MTVTQRTAAIRELVPSLFPAEFCFESPTQAAQR
jgi:hypothetical protein